MRTFKVYRHPTQGMEAVKLGFSWPAFFFGVLWMLVKRLWGLAIIWMLAYLVLAALEYFLVPGGIDGAAPETAPSGPQALVSLLLAVAYFFLWLAPGFKGNRWRAADLEKRGYQLQGTVEAKNPEAALDQLAPQQA